MSRTLVAVFDSYERAENAASQIKSNGLRTEDISIVAKQGDKYETNNTNDRGITASMGTMGSKGRQINDNISDGVVTGGILGGLAGLLIGAGSMAIPGFGIIAAAGPITGLLSGAVTGGIVGGLIDLGIPENKSRQYETDIKAGKILFSMRTDEDKIDKVASILRANGAISVESY
ncbi:MAG: general stress protein [Clostridia bacterium]|nr:general stress protein [Clostridia bacterium]